MRYLLLLTALCAYSQGVVVVPGGIGTVPGSNSGGGNPSTAVYLTRATDQAGTDKYCRSTTGNDSYVCSLTPALTTYTTGGCVVLSGDTANVGTATLNINSLGAKSILTRAAGALSNGDITANAPITLCYDGTQFIIQGDGGGGGGAVSSVTAGVTGAISVTPTTGAVVVDIDTAYLCGKTLSCTVSGLWSFGLLSTSSNCSSSASPAVCAAAPTGSVTVAAAATTKVVNTTAVTANSQIILTFDSSLGTKLGVTCNTTYVDAYVTARTAATSFTITVASAPTTNPVCLSYAVVN